jgi:hypothetical protein
MNFNSADRTFLPDFGDLGVIGQDARANWNRGYRVHAGTQYVSAATLLPAALIGEAVRRVRTFTRKTTSR